MLSLPCAINSNYTTILVFIIAIRMLFLQASLTFYRLQILVLLP
ncbi:hypothetical protein BVRB_3g059890 [Beta vulgaris subsp. vulgaris]|uniref:Uncharacterized protein n=1 Tax=Beta vulgaris subsp. vulgaris TaxID=3555 RepID=A0A0J8CNX8_BETVV|nr:hypothetical protein BVRB_3g059890 [Beta vulgaris subsp. vulgaris]